MSHQPASDGEAHLAAATVAVPADFALARLSEAVFVGQWALGSMGLVPSGQPNVWRGRSLFDGSDAHVEIAAHPELGLIDYHVGTIERRSPRIMIRVVSGSVIGLDASHCRVSLIAWRAVGAAGAIWMRTCTTHETEVLLIKAQLETAHAASAAP